MTVKDTVLFGKYQLIRTLGQGRSGTVYLAVHTELQEQRAIKQVPKAAAGYEQFLKEALLLKRLKHPGIPIVYDVYEDEKYSYLVEEFLEGNSFYDLVRERGPLNQETAIRYGIQICDLIHYLHSAEEIPILYLDLQPRNLIVCHGQVKLLDFDHSDTILKSNEAGSRYGTPGYIAPEQRLGGRLGVDTDVYQIGAILYYLLTGRTARQLPLPETEGRIWAVIRRCLREDREERYASALEVGEELKQLCSGTECLDRSKLPSLIIALAGTRSGVGVTHLSIGLAVYLNRMGYPALYEEHNHSNDVRAMAENLGVRPDSYGLFTIFRQPMKPRYGDAVRLREPDYPVIVRDYGTNMEELLLDEAKLSAVWLVQEGKWWNRRSEAAKNLEDRPDLCVLYNLAVPGAVKRSEGRRRDNSYQTPVFQNPFQPGAEAEAFYGALTSRFPTFFGRKRGGALWDCFGKKTGRKRKGRGSSA